MDMHRSVRLSFAGAVVLTMFGIAPIGMAQTTPPPPRPPTQQPVPPPPPPPPATTMPAPPPQAMPAQPQTSTAPAPPPQTMPAQPQTSTAPAPPPQTMPAQPAEQAQQPSSTEFYQGTESSARYPLPDSNGGTLTVNAGMPANVQSYGPPPSFETLDSNHDGRIDEAEAQAYPPLDSDFLYASGQGKAISRARYEKWVQNQQ